MASEVLTITWYYDAEAGRLWVISNAEGRTLSDINLLTDALRSGVPALHASLIGVYLAADPRYPRSYVVETALGSDKVPAEVERRTMPYCH